jgi:hypothetical protein
VERTWQEILTPIVTAQSEYVTVFLKAHVDWDSEFNAGHFDDFALLMDQPPTPPPSGSEWTEGQIRALAREEALKALSQAVITVP